MTPNKYTELNRSVETVRTSARIDDIRNLDRRAADRARIANFNDTRYLDTPPAQHMTATWGN
jgi:hypothetical protein